jgi:flagellar biosynthesis/type III secretory pathway chaperone
MSDAGMSTQLSAHELTDTPSDRLSTSVPVDAARLSELLAQEFELLKIRNIAGFEALQEERITLLERLAWVAEWATAQSPVPQLWQDLQPGLQQCKQDHLRNIQLLQRQLQGVKGALQALQGESSATVDLYDRMGKVTPCPVAGPFLDA